MNENTRRSAHADPELVELFNALTGPQLMGLEPEEKAALFEAGEEAAFKAEGKTTLLDAREKVLTIAEGSDELMEAQIMMLSLAILEAAGSFRTEKEAIRSSGLKGFLKKTVDDLTARKKALPDKPSQGMMIFGFVSAVLMAAGILLLFFHPTVSGWFNEKAAGVILTILAIVVTVGVLIATGSFIGGGVGFVVFALVTWLINKLIPLHIFLKILVALLLGLGALVMYFVGKNEIDAFRDGNDRKRDELVRPLKQDIRACKDYALMLKKKAERAKGYAAANHTGEERRLAVKACEAVVFYYDIAGEQLNELSESLAKD